MTFKAIDIANELLRLASNEEATGSGELMTNMKLQKLLYYQQGFHLAAFGTPLFAENIEAWMYGPVVPEIYHTFEGYGGRGISIDTDTTPLSFESQEEQQLFMDVYGLYSQYSAIGLMKMTHEEEPWSTSPVGKGCIINRDVMSRFFKTRLS